MTRRLAPEHISCFADPAPSARCEIRRATTTRQRPASRFSERDDRDAASAFLLDVVDGLTRRPQAPLPLLQAAHDDPQGLTRAFNLSLLARMDRELSASFDLAAFRHVATWDPASPAMESGLEPVRDQEVRGLTDRQGWFADALWRPSP